MEQVVCIHQVIKTVCADHNICVRSEQSDHVSRYRVIRRALFSSRHGGIEQEVLLPGRIFREDCPRLLGKVVAVGPQADIAREEDCRRTVAHGVAH
jgi:hypothetical protein